MLLFIMVFGFQPEVRSTYIDEQYCAYGVVNSFGDSSSVDNQFSQRRIIVAFISMQSLDIIIAHVNLCTQVLTSVILCLRVQLHNVY